jgi:hypothetical protein
MIEAAFHLPPLRGWRGKTKPLREKNKIKKGGECDGRKKDW